MFEKQTSAPVLVEGVYLTSLRGFMRLKAALASSGSFPLRFINMGPYSISRTGTVR